MSKAIEVTPEMVNILKHAVRALEESWDAQRDFELEIGRDWDQLSEYVCDLAVMGADGVDEDIVRQILTELNQGNDND